MFIFHVMLTLHFLSSETPLLCLHTLDSGKHLLAVISCPTARPSPFHHTTQKPLPLTELGSATTSTQVLQRCVDIVFLFSHDRLKKFCVLGYNLGWYILHSYFGNDLVNKNGWLCSHTVEYYFPFVHSFCVRSTTWSKRAGHQTCDATRYHWIEMRKEMDPQPRGFVWMGSQPGRDDWEMCSMIALQEWTRTRSSLFQLTGLTSTPMEVKHTFTSWQILCQLKGLNFRCLALLFGTIFFWYHKSCVKVCE